jgi:hypothetical protein
MNLPLAPLIAAVAGGLAALGVALIPVPALESLVMDSGLPAVLSAAEPPLGFTARIAVALASGGFVALFMWLSAFILLGSRGLTIGGAAPVAADEELPPPPVIRRADAHPDARPRPPLLATRDLGEPFEPRAPQGEERVDFDAIFPKRAVQVAAPVPVVTEEMEVPTAAEPVPFEHDLPVDLNQPLSAFDPAAIPTVPKPAPVPLAPLRRTARPAIFDEGERFETFELTPPVRRAAPVAPTLSREAIVRPETDASIHALLERLERGVSTKAIAPTAEPRPRDAERGLEEALVTLRNLARRTG